jgi:hypothetical protein
MLRFVDFQNFIRTEKENCNLSYNFFINFLEINFEIITIFYSIVFHGIRYYISRKLSYLMASLLYFTEVLRVRKKIAAKRRTTGTSGIHSQKGRVF